MYKQEELLKKVNGHLKDKEINLLNSLIKDLDEFNEKYGNGIIETYIDFDDVGNDSEFDTYETFSIKLHNKVDGTKFDENVHDNLNIDQLDDCLCAIEQYHEEMQEMLKPVDDSLKKCNEGLEAKIRNAKEDGKILFMQDENTIATATFDDFTKQPLCDQLYDLNRLREVILSFRDEDWKKYSQRWVNDLALVNLLEYYYNKCYEV